jgi:hypothetical protein
LWYDLLSFIVTINILWYIRYRNILDETNNACGIIHTSEVIFNLNEYHEIFLEQRRNFITNDKIAIVQEMIL